ncbi:MAG: N-acetyltransferase [Candidatus Thiodiazotropha sp. (ex Notomyrtea botanica)]|nr:N-acetyltransferase [Candidatus Thiodiazotropha sp. (ex Notomyrtea botanica)]
MKFETPNTSDAEEIKRLFTTVFSDSEGQSEGILIGNLAYELITETDEQDHYGLVAIEHEKIIGCIFFSRLTFESEINTFILAPVAIHTEHQGMGIGQKLINLGIKRLKEKGVELIMTYGDPNFYSKVGFNPVALESIKAPFNLSLPEGWLGQSLVSDSVESIPGLSKCVKALNKPEYW